LWLSSHSISQLPLHLLGECQRKGLVISLCFVCLWKDWDLNVSHVPLLVLGSWLFLLACNIFIGFPLLFL
jgi:hypothetical protein